MLTLTVGDLRTCGACELEYRVESLEIVLGRTPAEWEQIPLSVWWGLHTTSVRDRFWSLRAVKPWSQAQLLGVRAICRAARRVLPRINEESRLITEAAIAAAEKWTGEPTQENARTAALAGMAATKVGHSLLADPRPKSAAYAVFAAVAVARSLSACAEEEGPSLAADDASAWLEEASCNAVASEMDLAILSELSGPLASQAERQRQTVDLDKLLAELDAQQESE